MTKATYLFFIRSSHLLQTVRYEKIECDSGKSKDVEEHATIRNAT